MSSRFRFLIWIALAFWAWMLVDLITHPFSAGPNEGGSIFRWLSGLTGLATVLTALFIMRRVPANPAGILLLLWGVGATGWSLRSEWVSVPLGTLATSVFALIFFCISCPAAILLLFHFPDGKPFPPGLTRWIPSLTILLSVSGLFYIVGFNSESSTGNIPNPLFIRMFAATGQKIYLACFVLVMMAALVTLVFRYRAGNERLRLQIRWLAWLLGIGIFFAVFPFARIFGEQVDLVMMLAGFIFWQSFLTLGIGIAILQHNLWGIDVLIRRTLVYGVLTATLALVFFGGVTLLQQVVGRLIGTEDSPVAIVLSTLAIAALFSPLRRRIQDFIDRRFYRQKYNAEQALADFAASARNETDLEALTGKLVELVSQTMQPERVSVWLRINSGRRSDRRMSEIGTGKSW